MSAGQRSMVRVFSPEEQPDLAQAAYEAKRRMQGDAPPNRGESSGNEPRARGPFNSC